MEGVIFLKTEMAGGITGWSPATYGVVGMCMFELIVRVQIGSCL